MRIDRRQFAIGLGMSCALSPRLALAADKLVYLFPTVVTLPAFAPFHVARAKGFFAEEGLAPEFLAAKGGVDAAKQIGAGNADLAGGIGDTPIILRPNGIPVRGVALLGGRPLHQLIVRKDLGFGKYADLKGKRIGVVSYQDTSFYNLLGVLASAGLGKDDADVRAVGPAGMTQLMARRELDAIVGAPEWAMIIERNGTAVDVHQIDDVFPAMAQAVLASDETIQKRPAIVKGFVRAILKGVGAISADPQNAATIYLKETKQSLDGAKETTRILSFYAQHVYPERKGARLGAFDAARVERVQKFYLDKKIIREATPVADLFTNQFVT